MIVLSAKPGFFERLHETTDRTVDPADHAVIGAHVGLIFFVGVPSPEITLAVDRRLQKIGLGIKDRRIIQSRRSDLDILVHSIDRSRPREMPDARAAIAVLGVAGVEPHVQGERLVFRLRLHELNPAIDDQFRFVPQAAIGLLLVVRISPDRLELVKVIFSAIALRHLGVPLAKVSGAVTVLAQDVGVQRLDGIGPCLIGIARRAVAAAGQSGEDRRAADPADRMADKGVLESQCPARASESMFGVWTTGFP